jgi:hypothetical protein
LADLYVIGEGNSSIARVSSPVYPSRMKRRIQTLRDDTDTSLAISYLEEDGSVIGRSG